MSRLFPFENRGLCHAYWAPNFWAIYNIVDKILAVSGIPIFNVWLWFESLIISWILARLFGWTAVSTTTASMTGGLVQEFEHSILPSVGPKTTLICTLLALIVRFYAANIIYLLKTNHSQRLNLKPAIVILLRQPNQPRVFVRAIVLCAFASFLFGWHVHEKAILIVITPLTSVLAHFFLRLNQ